MRINRKNYEVWMIDYFDGKLNANEVNELMIFIDANDDIREEFELFSHEKIEKEEIRFSTKEDLKKKPVLDFEEINESNYETFFIAAFEKDLNEKQIKSLTRFLEINLHLRKEFDLHAKLQLSPDPDLVFPEKESLRKKPALRPLVYWFSGAAAAVILLFFTIFNLFIEGSGIKSPTDNNFKLTYLKPADPKFILSSNDNFHLHSKSFDKVTISYHVQEGFSAITTTTAIQEDIAILNPRTIALNPDPGSAIEMISLTPEYDVSEIYAYASQSADQERKKGILGRLIKNIAKRVNEDDVAGPHKNSPKKDPAFVRVLDQSITVFNTITGSDNQLVKTYNNDGSLSKYRFEGQALSWSKDISSNSE